nr:D-alanyl-D-alanine carboxypeptidase [Fibrobacterota bacterium]
MAGPYHIHDARKGTITALCAGLLAICAWTPAFPKSPASVSKAKSESVAKSASAQTASRKAAAGPAVYFPREAMIGWAVRDVAAEGYLESQSGDLNFTPGSTQKLFTTWIALDLLGGDRTYLTELFRTGSLEAGTLKGDLIIRGGGDPSFGGAHFGPNHGAETIFAKWALALRNLGISKVEGCIIGDGSYLEEEGPHPAGLWEDAGNYYAGIVSGLSFFDNLYFAHFTGASGPGKPVALLRTVPAHTGIARFDNRLLTGPSDSQDSAYILGGFPGASRALRGTYPAGRMPFTIKGSLPNPAWTCAREFRDFLAGKGISVSAEAGSRCGDSLALPNHEPVRGGTAVPGARHVSPPLREILRIVNQKSDNNFAAQTLALLGKGTGRSADWRGGL